MPAAADDWHAATLAAYRSTAAAWDRARRRCFAEKPWIDRFLALVPPAAPVLDLGCGAGEPIAAHLIAAGHPLTGVDAAPEMLAICRARFPGAEWVEADMRALDLGRRFGGIVAWDSFFHLDRAAQRATLPRIAAHLAPRGALLFTSGPREGEADGSVAGKAVHHASLGPGEYRRILAAAGLSVAAQTTEDPACGGHTVWLAIRCDEA